MGWATFWAIFLTNSSGHPGCLAAVKRSRSSSTFCLRRHLLFDVINRVANFFFFYNIPKREKINEITIKYTKWPQNAPNGRKIDRMAIK
jgi:hypothetical protein